jgi:hypothetical protein
MAHLFRNVNDVVSLPKPQGCIGVPQVVNPDVPQPRLLEDLDVNPFSSLVLIEQSPLCVVEQPLRRLLPSVPESLLLALYEVGS